MVRGRRTGSSSIDYRSHIHRLGVRGNLCESVQSVAVPAFFVSLYSYAWFVGLGIVFVGHLAL